MKFQKGFAAIFAEIAVVAIIIGAFIYASPKFKNSPQPSPSPAVSPSPSPVDETVNWQMYTNKAIGFYFKYPPYLIPNSLGKVDQTELVSFAQDSKEKLLLSVLPNPQNIDLQKFSEKVKLQDTKREYSKAEINGYQALLLRTKWPCTEECEPNKIKNEQYHVDFKVNGFVVGFKINTFDQSGGTSVSEEEWLNQILSTFKFLDSAPSPSPTKSPTVCIQVIQPAFNQQTGECKQFPTPCDVPEGWAKVSSCPTTECPKPPVCTGNLVIGDPNPSDPNQCPRYQCLQ